MASAEKLPSKRWRGLYRDSAGNKQRVPGTFPRKSDAIEAAQELEVAARRTAAAANGTLSAKTLWGDWWDSIAVDREFDSDTSTTEENIVRGFVRPQWGDTPLVKIEQPDVQAWVDQLCRDGHSAGYVRRIYGVFRVSITKAVPEVLRTSPCSKVKLPTVPQKPQVFLDVDDMPTIGEHLTQPWKDAAEFMLETGLRPGELGGLHAHRANRKTGWLTVAEVLVARKKVIRPWPKDKDTREVPLSAKASEILDRRLAGRDPRAGCGLPHTDNATCTNALVFEIEGRPLLPTPLGWALARASEKAKTTHKTPYSARRGYATRLASGGLDAFALAELMGHSDVAVTREYVQRTEAAKAKVLAALGDRQPLKAVGQRGTERGTELDNQPLSEARSEVDEKRA